MNYTKNLRLNKPEYDEVVDIEKLNDNFDAIDAKLIQKATQSADGLLSATDKKKLDNIEDYANKIIVDTELSSSSTNPVQNKVVKSYVEQTASQVQDAIKSAITGVYTPKGSIAFSALPTGRGRKQGLGVQRRRCLHHDGGVRRGRGA